MEDVVAIKFGSSSGKSEAALTYGRIFGAIESKELLNAVRVGLEKLGRRKIKNLKICFSLNDVANQTYFYEGLLHFAWNPIPFGVKSYGRWQKQIAREIQQGKHIYLISSKGAEPGSIAHGTLPYKPFHHLCVSG